MIDLKDLKQFLLKANQPHADGTAKLHQESDGSRTIVFRSGDWSMNDNFFGGEPYGGRQIVFYKDQPAWLCVYYGRVTTDDNADDIYDFLREALQHPVSDQPYRGPDNYKKGKLEYRNLLEGDADNFTGKEAILKAGQPVYWAHYLGGLVDQRFKGSL